jgi:hypothetical protein
MVKTKALTRLITRWPSLEIGSILTAYGLDFGRPWWTNRW